MGEMVLWSGPRREDDLDRYRDDPLMMQVLGHAHAVQRAVDADIRAWGIRAEGTLSEVLPWIDSHRVGGKHFTNATEYDFRRHARAIAAQLLFKAADPYTRAPSTISSRALQDRWTDEERTDYFRCVAICSAHWKPKA